MNLWPMFLDLCVFTQMIKTVPDDFWDSKSSCWGSPRVWVPLPGEQGDPQLIFVPGPSSPFLQPRLLHVSKAFFTQPILKY